MRLVCLLLLFLPLLANADPAPAPAATFDFTIGDTPFQYPIESGYRRLSEASPRTYETYTAGNSPDHRMVEILMLDSDIKLKMIGKIPEGTYFQIQALRSLENLSYDAGEWSQFQQALAKQMGELDFKSLIRHEAEGLNKRLNAATDNQRADLAMAVTDKPRVYLNDAISTRFIMVLKVNSANLAQPVKIAVVVATVYARNKIFMICAGAQGDSEASLDALMRRLDGAVSAFMALNAGPAPPAPPIVATPAATTASVSPEQARIKSCDDAQNAPDIAIIACSALIADDKAAKDTRVNAYSHRAIARYMTGHEPEALVDLGKAIELDPATTDVYNLRGGILAMSGDMEAARKDFLKATQLDPKDATAFTAMGMTYDKQEDPAHALPFYDRAIALDPKSGEALNNRCWARAVLNQALDKALADCDGALALDPKDATILNSRGFVRFRMGRYQEAIVDYDAAIAGEPGEASSYYVRGLAKRALGQTAAGDADVAKGLGMRPELDKLYVGYGIVGH